MRKVYLLPNFLTTANMFCGFYSIIASIHHDYVTAAWAVVAAGVFDMLDGRIARLVKATSQFGVEYDSLSDLMSFGLAPSLLLYLWALEPFARLGTLAAFLFLTCAALRLARFNCNTGVLPKNYFQGLPVPMAAAAIVSFVIFQEDRWPGMSGAKQAFILVTTLVLASLMVSNMRFPSFKELHWGSRASFGYFLLGVLCMVLVAARPDVALFGLVGGYIGVSLVWDCAARIRRWRKRHAARIDLSILA